MPVEIYSQGNVIVVEGKFRRQSDGVLVDPDTVKLSLAIRAPEATELAGPVVEHVYGEGDVILRDEVGVYHADLLVDQAGTWWFRWWSDGEAGDVVASEEAEFEVRAAVTWPPAES